MTYGTLIQTQTIASATPTITFSAIPQTYTDLVLVVSQTTNRANNIDQINFTVNGSSAGYYTRLVYGSGSTTGGEVGPTSTFTYCYASGAPTTANTFSSIQMVIPNYTSSVAKTFSIEAVNENNASTGAWQNFVAGGWSGTAAITSISMTPNYGPNFNANTTASLYGISKDAVTTGTIKASGGTIVQAGGYTYHVFTASGTFTPTTSVTADVLVVAGGGGGSGGNPGSGFWYGAGGGAGGLRVLAAQTITGSATVTVGAGGGDRTNGNNSSFSTISTTGGGRGGVKTGTSARLAANSGGSGGGSDQLNASTSPGTGNAGGYTPVEGYAGGNGLNDQFGGGGGGAGSVGENAPSDGTRGGNGGSGANSYNSISIATWLSVTGSGSGGYLAGGGGAGGNGSGGTGGGGGGASSAGSNGTAAVVNTGGGGGGGGGSQFGGAGGSGIVIVRYQ